MNPLAKRLEKLEAAAFRGSAVTVRRFVIDGPAVSHDEASDFLRSCGHEIHDDDMTIIRVVVSPDRVAPSNLCDLTPGKPVVSDH